MENPLALSYVTSIDEELVINSLKGDKHSLNALLKRHQDYIFNISLKMLNSVSDAEDATQEILIKVVTNLSTYDATKGSLRTWLYRITFNHILNVKKSPYEKHELTFTKFFNFLDEVPDIPFTEEEKKTEFFGETVEEARVSCTAGMLMCLDRSQRLVYIVGEIFKIHHHLAAEIFEIKPGAFRKRLSRARKDIHEWMHRRCGLVNKDNPCRCQNKTKKFIEMGVVDPQNRKWLSEYRYRIFQNINTNMDDMLDNFDKLYGKVYQEDPFKISLKAQEIYDQVLSDKDFIQYMNL